jgi:hypothetical protein
VAATMPGLKNADYGWNVREPRDKGDKRRRDWRTVQVHVRAAVRPNQAVCPQKGQFLGTCSKPQSPSACGTQAVGCVFGDPAGCSALLDRVTREGTHCRAPVRGGWSHELRSTAGGAADAANRPSFRTPLKRRRNRRRPASPGAGQNHGAMTRVCSPDGAQRNPGFRIADSAPDFASLHPATGNTPGLFDN